MTNEVLIPNNFQLKTALIKYVENCTFFSHKILYLLRLRK